MSWSIRHEGSPRSIEGLTPQQVVEGLQDGLWEPTDEVKAPQSPNWVAIENHPQFAEVAADLEPPPAKVYDDETRLDMTALIDVTLVLLIFSILTISYAAMEKKLDSAEITANAAKGPIQITEQKVKELMIDVKVKMEKGAPVILVENEVVSPDNLLAALRGYVQGQRGNRKTELLIEHDGEVPHGSVVAIQDAAKGAGVQQVHVLVPKEELPR